MRRRGYAFAPGRQLALASLSAPYRLRRRIDAAWAAVLEFTERARGRAGRDEVAGLRGAFASAWAGEAEPPELGELERGVWLLGGDARRAAELR